MARVLVVDDDPAVCELIQDVLQEVRFEAVCVSGDEAAYRRIPTLPTIQALVVDVNLGSGTTGYDVARFARQVIPDLPVLYISGEVGTETFHSHAVPGSGFLEKPFMADELLAALLSRLKLSKGSSAKKRPRR
jgi:CheY-like chemotaxis protein